MTYCAALRLRDGMVFAADSRTNAGVDHISIFRKMHIFEQSRQRFIVALSSGNLATAQSVVSLLNKRAAEHDVRRSVHHVDSMFEVAMLVGDTLREVIAHNSESKVGEKPGRRVDFGASFIVGGQIAGEQQRLFLVYPEGNFIEATEDTPYFQIGEIKYGKPILDRVIRFDTPILQATQCTLISFDSTLRSNLSVGMPIDLLILPPDTLEPSCRLRITEEDNYFRELSRAWEAGLKELLSQLPLPPADIGHLATGV